MNKIIAVKMSNEILPRTKVTFLADTECIELKRHPAKKESLIEQLKKNRDLESFEGKLIYWKSFSGKKAEIGLIVQIDKKEYGFDIEVESRYGKVKGRMRIMGDRVKFLVSQNEGYYLHDIKKTIFVQDMPLRRMRIGVFDMDDI